MKNHLLRELRVNFITDEIFVGAHSIPFFRGVCDSEFSEIFKVMNIE